MVYGAGFGFGLIVIMYDSDGMAEDANEDKPFVSGFGKLTNDAEIV
jgi:hypothetical protein